MPADTVKPNPSSMEADRNKHIDREIRDMVSALTNRLTNLQPVHKPGSSHPLGDEDEHGVRIITLAGTNTGATMRGDLSSEHRKHEVSPDDELQGLDNYVNSNYQAVNNSIMLDANYNSNDPGVHMDIAEIVEPHKHHRFDKHGRRGMRKGKELAHGEAHSEFSE